MQRRFPGRVQTMYLPHAAMAKPLCSIINVCQPPVALKPTLPVCSSLHFIFPTDSLSSYPIPQPSPPTPIPDDVRTEGPVAAAPVPARRRMRLDPCNLNQEDAVLAKNNHGWNISAMGYAVPPISAPGAPLQAYIERCLLEMSAREGNDPN
jgi:hypothetical protein